MTEYEQKIIRKMEESGRCPACHLIDNEEFDMLSRVQYDVTHSPEVREAIVNEGGFCEFHFRQFRKIASARTNGLLMVGMVQWYSTPKTEYVVKCRLCDHLNAFECEFLSTIVSLLQTEAFRNKYAQHTGLCIQHLQKIVDVHQLAKWKEWLIDTQREQMKHELHYLEEMATQSYYETSNVARGSLVRTVEKFVGRRTLSM